MKHAVSPWIALLALAVLGLNDPVVAQPEPSDVEAEIEEAIPATPGSRGDWSAWIRPDTSYVWGGDVDGPGGDIDVWISRIAVGAGGAVWKGARLDLRLDYEQRRYDFEGPNDFFAGSDEPWRDVNSVGFNATLLQALGRRWGVLLGGGLRVSAEAGAELFDGVSWNVLAGVGYQFSRSFRLGAGVAVLKRLERSVIVVPAIQLDWKIDEQWRFKIEGPGAELSYRPDEEWTLALGARYSSRWFRLEDDDVTRGGIAADRRLPVYLRVTWSPDEDVDLSLTGGVDVYRNFEIGDENGNHRQNYDADPGVFIGVGLTFRL